MAMGVPPWSTKRKVETGSLCGSCDATMLLLEVCQALLFIEWAGIITLQCSLLFGYMQYEYVNITSSYFVAIVPGFGPVCVEFPNIVRPGILLYLSTVYLATRISVIVADVIVLMVTWMKTYEIKRYANSAHVEAPLATLLLRDGTLYFTLLLVLNLSLMLSNYYGPRRFMCIIVSRFLLNLRETDNVQNHVASNPSFVCTHARSLQLASRIVGNMGASLSHGSPSQVDDLYGLDLPGNGLDISEGGGATQWMSKFRGDSLITQR
ncbi:hypothetical protein BKA93DRAFT_753393 [Sparassis latifolia]